MKYFQCLLLIAIASSAYAQLECYSCTNCENVQNQPRITCAHPPTGPTTIATTPTTTTQHGFDPLPPLTPSVPPVPGPTPINPAPPVTNPTLPNLTPSTINPNAAQDETTETLLTENDPNTPGLVRKRREADAFAAHFSCFRIRVPAATAGQTQVNRGCVQNGGSTEQTCQRAHNYVGNVTECRICSGNRCNSSSGLFASVILVLASVFIAFKAL